MFDAVSDVLLDHAARRSRRLRHTRRVAGWLLLAGWVMLPLLPLLGLGISFLLGLAIF